MRSREESAAAAAREKTALLSRLTIFEGLEPDELEQVAALAVPRSYAAGEVIFREGDPAETCFVVRSGSVRITRTHPSGRRITLAELRPGDMFGELSMLDGAGRSATVEALEETTAVALLARDVRRLLIHHPDMAVKMLARLASRLRHANEQVARQSFQPVAGRVASALLSQVSARQRDGAGAENVVVEATQSDIAQLAGTSRESASRFLADLERAGVVTTGRGKVVVHDPAALDNYIY